MAQQKQQSQQAIGYTTAPGIGFPNLPAQISSTQQINRFPVRSHPMLRRRPSQHHHQAVAVVRMNLTALAGHQ
jgi:hypothetical protein